MNELALVQFIQLTFLPFIPHLAGPVIVFIFALLFYLALRDQFLE